MSVTRLESFGSRSCTSSAAGAEVSLRQAKAQVHGRLAADEGRWLGSAFGQSESSLSTKRSRLGLRRPWNAMRQSKALGLVTFCVGLVLSCGAPKALEFVNSRAGLAGTDFINWGVLGAPSSFPSQPLTMSTNLGTSFTATMPLAPLTPFRRFDQTVPCPGLACPWQGNFQTGDRLL